MFMFNISKAGLQKPSNSFKRSEIDLANHGTIHLVVEYARSHDLTASECRCRYMAPTEQPPTSINQSTLSQIGPNERSHST